VFDDVVEVVVELVPAAVVKVHVGEKVAAAWPSYSETCQV
jgi:hypothetical protein